MVAKKNTELVLKKISKKDRALTTLIKVQELLISIAKILTLFPKLEPYAKGAIKTLELSNKSLKWFQDEFYTVYDYLVEAEILIREINQMIKEGTNDKEVVALFKRNKKHIKKLLKHLGVNKVLIDTVDKAGDNYETIKIVMEDVRKYIKLLKKDIDTNEEVLKKNEKEEVAELKTDVKEVVKNLSAEPLKGKAAERKARVARKARILTQEEHHRISFTQRTQ